jgi:hypothetical protein
VAALSHTFPKRFIEQSTQIDWCSRLEHTRQSSGVRQIAPDRPSVAGPPADKRFGSRLRLVSRGRFELRR